MVIKNYYKPTGRSGTGGTFQQLQTGGQASVERIRQQAQPIIDSLQQQQTRTDQYYNDWIQSRQRADTVETRNKGDIKDFEDLVWKAKGRAEERVAKAEIEGFKTKAQEYEKASNFWLNFSTTYSKQYGEAAKNIYSSIAEYYAEKDFENIVSGGLAEGLPFTKAPTEDPYGSDELRQRYNEEKSLIESQKSKVNEEVWRILSKKGELNREEKEYIKANLKILGNTSYELQQKLVDYEIENSDNRWIQLKELLGDKYNPEDASALATRLAFLVSTRTGITNVNLQRKLLAHYRKEANANSSSAYNYRHSVETNQTASDHLESWHNNKTQSNFNAVLNSAIALEDKNGKRLYPNPRAGLSYIIKESPKAFDSPEDFAREIARMCTPGTGEGTNNFCVTWKDRYSKGDGAAWNNILEEIDEAFEAFKRERVTAANTDASYEDLKKSDVLKTRWNLWKEYSQLKKSNPDLTEEQFMKDKGITDPKLGPINPNGREIQSISKGLLSGDTKQRQIVSEIQLFNNKNLNKQRTLADIELAFSSGNESYGEFLLKNADPGLIGDDGEATLRLSIAAEEYAIAKQSGIFDVKKLRDTAKGELSKVTGIKLKTAKEDPSVRRAEDLYIQAVRYYYWDDPAISKDKTLTPEKRYQAAVMAANADIAEGSGIWSRIEPGDEANRAVLSTYFPALSSDYREYQGRPTLTKDEFQKKLTNSTNTLYKGERQNFPWWLTTTRGSDGKESLAWTGPVEMQGYARQILNGDSDNIKYSERVEAIATKAGLYPYQVVNAVFERLGYTERIPSDITEYIDIAIDDLNDITGKIEGIDSSGQETIKSRMLGGTDHYNSPDANPTRLLYYKLSLLKKQLEEADGN